MLAFIAMCATIAGSRTSTRADEPAAAPPASRERSSTTDSRLKQLLKRFPKADANGDGVLTLPEAQAYQQRRKEAQNQGAKNVLTPDRQNIAYGPHERNVLDLWLAARDQPTPLVVCIHGGGFQGGDKSKYHTDSIVRSLLDAGISVAAINYRLTDGGRHPYPIPMHDGARAVQFLRHHAKEYNLNPTRVACTGGSAGACLSMWLAYHDDLSDPDNADPVLRQSTRLTAIAPNAGQPILDLRDFEELFDVHPLREHPALRPLFGIPAGGPIVWTDQLADLARDASPITHLTADDAPTYLTYGPDQPVLADSEPGVWVHHPRLGMHLQQAMDKLGVECHLNYQGGPQPETYRTSLEFLIDKLSHGGTAKGRTS